MCGGGDSALWPSPVLNSDKTALGRLVAGQPILGKCNFYVIRRQQFAAHLQAGAPPRLRLGIPALSLIDFRQKLLAIGDVDMLQAAPLHENIERVAACDLGPVKLAEFAA